jgi:hypothetical protein
MSCTLLSNCALPVRVQNYSTSQSKNSPALECTIVQPEAYHPYYDTSSYRGNAMIQLEAKVSFGHVALPDSP